MERKNLTYAELLNITFAFLISNCMQLVPNQREPLWQVLMLNCQLRQCHSTYSSGKYYAVILRDIQRYKT